MSVSMGRARRWRLARLGGLALLLTAGVLGWEWVLARLLSGGYGVRAETVGLRLVKDAALLLPVWLGTVGSVYGLSRGRKDSRALTASLLALTFLLLMGPVAIGRSVWLQRAPAPARPSPGAASSALSAEPGEDSGRFLCAVARPDLSLPADAEGGSWVDAVWAGGQEALLLQVPVLPLALLLVRRRTVRPAGLRGPGPASRISPRGSLGLLGVLGLALASDAGRPVVEDPDPGPGGEEARGVCPPGAPVRTYAVAARAADLLLNPHGEHVPQGLAYVLDAPAAESLGAPAGPLVLRANLGECLHLRFTNRWDGGSAALHIEGLRATVVGASPGDFIPGASVAPGHSLTYVLALPEEPSAEGAWPLHDSEDGGGREARGLFGALVLEPAGSRYREVSTGQSLAQGHGWEALVDPPSGGSFREMVLLAHALGPPEVADVRSARGALLPVLDEMAGPFRPGAYGLNYRSLPQFEREPPPDGDDAPRPRPQALTAPLLRSYPGEPVRLRLVHAGSAEPHIPHVHDWDEHQGPHAHAGPGTPLGAPHLLMPGGRLTLASTPGDTAHAAGDFLVHCHVPNHSTGGERVTWRIYPTLQAGLAPLAPRAPP